MAFENQSHILFIQSFVRNGVRKSRIPVLINIFSTRKLITKWKNGYSTPREVTGGSPQGITSRNLEFLSQSCNSMPFPEENDEEYISLEHREVYDFIDDSSFIEIINLITAGLSCYNFKQQVASDISQENQYIPPDHLQTNKHLEKISKWSDQNLMQLNCQKTKYMILNFCKSKNFQTRLSINNTLLEQVHETRLLGLVISEDLTWHSNTNSLVKRAYARMIILKRLYHFNLPKYQMIQIYILYIRSITEQSSVVWSSSITEDEVCALERTQKVALKIIYQNEYISYENALLGLICKHCPKRGKFFCIDLG